MSFSKVESALVKAFTDGAFFPVENVGFENISFNPPVSGAPWACVWFVPSSPTVATLGAGGADLLQGYLQIDLYYPLNAGRKPANDKADALRLLFTAGARFAYSGQEVVVANCGRSQGRVESGFWKVVVKVEFYAHITR